MPWSCDPLKGEKRTCVGLRPGLKTADEGTWLGSGVGSGVGSGLGLGLGLGPGVGVRGRVRVRVRARTRVRGSDTEWPCLALPLTLT